MNPKVIVILAGTNNIGSKPSEGAADQVVADVVAGIEQIVKVCRAKAPAAKLIVTGIFPRSDSSAAPAIIARINQQLAQLPYASSGNSIRFLDVNNALSDERGRLLPSMTIDGLHLTANAYQVWADGLRPLLVEFLGPPSDTDHAPPPTGDPSAMRAKATAPISHP